MGKLTNFVVVFDSPLAVFFPGQNVTGHVDVQLQESMNMRGIRLQFLGKAYVHWSTTTGSGEHQRTQHYSAKEIYLNITAQLVGSDESSYRMDLSPGSFRYPFTFVLPHNIPSSFEGGTGHVRYTVQATIDKPWKFDHVTRSAFTVVGITDLNFQPTEFKQPFTIETVGNVSCCCWKGGTVSSTLYINRRCFVPGEFILINAEIINNSTSDITGSKLALIQTVTFFASGSTRSGVHEQAIVQRNQTIAVGATDTWSNVAISVPPLPPTMLGGGCNIIHVNYVLKLSASAKCTNVQLPVEIIIGSIPLQQPPQQPMLGLLPEPSAPQMPPDFMMRTSQASAAPPSYEQCVNGPVSIREDGDSQYVRGELNWAPRYPVYAATPVDKELHH